MAIIPKSIKSRTNCCVDGCDNIAYKDPSIQYFRFPRKNQDFIERVNIFNKKEKIDRLDAWVEALKSLRKVTPSMRVCSAHFTTHDVIPSNCRIRHLKKNSVPSLNLPSFSQHIKISTVAKVSEQKKKIRPLILEKSSAVRKNCNRNNLETCNKKKDDCELLINRDVERSKEENDRELMINMDIERCESEEDNTKLKENTIPIDREDASVQVNSDYITLKFTNLITTEHELSTLTGIPNFHVLKTIQRLLSLKHTLIAHHNSKLDVSETIIMVFMKLKQNMTYAMLSCLFKKCSPGTCKIIFFDMINKLYYCLKPAIVWPHKENILKNLPQCFKIFKDVRAIIDCTEIALQKPKNIRCQTRNNSHYKDTCTVKFMIAITPAGMISLVSRAHEGCTSDNSIFESSEIIQLLDKNDVMFSNKELTIGELSKKFATLITPSFLKNQKRFTKSNVVLGHLIAKAQMCIEKVNQRIKTFNILNNELSTDLIPKVKPIFTIVCAIINLSDPILDTDKCQ